jgi:hypothetical protein
MIHNCKTGKIGLISLMGVLFIIGTVYLAQAELLFSTDIPVSMGSDSYKEKDIIRYNEPGFSLYNIEGVAFDEGINVDAFHFNESWHKFSVDTRTSLDGIICRCMDVVHYEGGQYYKAFNGIAEGIPPGACIDAATALPDESIVFSVDVPVSLGGTDYQENDLIRWDDVSFSLYFDGSANGIPEGANIDGVHITPEGMLHFSLDIPVQLGGIDLKDADIITYDSGYSLAFGGVSAGLPVGANIDAVSDSGGHPDDPDGDGIHNNQDNCPTDYNPGQEDNYPPQGNDIGDACECESDFDCDGDVDAFDMDSFLTDFGRGLYVNPCVLNNPCSGDFACDGDVDAFDITTFLEDFGRGYYVNPCPACEVGVWCIYP